MRHETLSWIATGRQESLFKTDIEDRKEDLKFHIKGARVLVIGGAGSIGSSTVHQLAQFLPRTLHVVDFSENNLVELVRDLRGSQNPLQVSDFRTLPIDFGSEIFFRFLLTQKAYDYILNFAALKHVRSEKDICSLLQMIDTNIVKQAKLIRWLAKTHKHVQYFSVSTDKAANPVNLMGATKKFMEHIIFSSELQQIFHRRITSARFANVAFSNGSLLFGWIQRLSKEQPIAVPSNTYRYFISTEEAGQICLLASILGMDCQIYIPKLNPKKDLREVAKIAKKFLSVHGLKPREYNDESDAINRVKADMKEDYYPLLLTPLDTNGEKPYEEFVGKEERSIEIGLKTICAIKYIPAPLGSVEKFLRLAELSIKNPQVNFKKIDFIKALAEVIPHFRYNKKGRNLDDRL
jgi:FlaA1/EpsC-like NDP-sugar epimerase